MFNLKHGGRANEHGHRGRAVVDGDRAVRHGDGDVGIERRTAAACVIVRKLLKDTGCETRGRDGAADGIRIEDGT